MSSSQPTPNNPSPGGSADTPPKVAIPRLQNRLVASRVSASREERRVPVACIACRSHKIRCSGDYPRCKNCENADRECVYVHHRRDRLKIATDQVVKMGNLLKDLRARTSVGDTTRINDVLQSVDEAMSNKRFTPSPSLAEGATDGFDTLSTTSIDTESLGLNDVYEPISHAERYGERDQLGLWQYDPDMHQQPLASQSDGHPTPDGLPTDNPGMFIDPNEYPNFPYR